MAKKNQLINRIYHNIPLLSENIANGFNNYYYYLECLKDEKFEEIKNETEEDAIQRALILSNNLDEMIKSNELSNKTAKNTIETLKKMTYFFNEIVKNTEDEKEKLDARNHELIDIINYLESRKNPIAMLNENIIFDSDIDGWNQNTSLFYEKVSNKKELSFLIEDTEGNLFGGHIDNDYKSYDNGLFSSNDDEREAPSISLYLYASKGNIHKHKGFRSHENPSEMRMGWIKFLIGKPSDEYLFKYEALVDYGMEASSSGVTVKKKGYSFVSVHLGRGFFDDKEHRDLKLPGYFIPQRIVFYECNR